MTSLRELRTRKKSVQATKKITSAMKLIAAAKLRRAQEQAQGARPYTTMMSEMLRDLLKKMPDTALAPKLLVGTGQEKTHLLIVATSNRGLCGGFNASILRYASRRIQEEEAQGREIKLVCIGRKGHDFLKRTHEKNILVTFEALEKPSFFEVSRIAHFLLEFFEKNTFDMCTVIYNCFISALTQKVSELRLIPYTPAGEEEKEREAPLPTSTVFFSPYIYEPHESQVLSRLLPENVRVQLFGVLLENAASEQGARMAAMEGATRNAEEMIKNLDLTYNRTRQAFITKELIEIISGAEAL